MRRMLLEYGKCFEKRAESLIVILLIINLFNFLFIIMASFKIITIENTDLVDFLKLFLILLVFMCKFL